MPALIFLVVSIALVVGAALLGGSVAGYWHAGSATLVLLGTLSVTAIGVDWADLKRLPDELRRLFTWVRPDMVKTARSLLEVAGRFRRDGVQALDGARRATKAMPFLHRGLELVQDGLPTDMVEQLLTAEADALARTRQRFADVLRRAGDVAPALGLVGTLMGLVQMMAKLHQPDQLGPAMALALLTTLYGALLSHLLFMPLAARAEANLEAERQFNLVCIAGLIAMSRREHPLHVEQHLNALLPADAKVKAA
jgi:chemotaxis protein MotA